MIDLEQYVGDKVYNDDRNFRTIDFLCGGTAKLVQLKRHLCSDGYVLILQSDSGSRSEFTYNKNGTFAYDWETTPFDIVKIGNQSLEHPPNLTRDRSVAKGA